MAAARGGGGFLIEEDDVPYGPHPDKPPTSPHASDDEFTTVSASTPSGWTIVEAGISGFDYDVNTSIESCLYMDITAQGAHTPGFYKACPSLPFRVTAKIAAYSNPLGTSNRTDVGLFIGEATPGKFIHGCLDVAEDNYMTICGSKWNSPTSWNSNIGDFLNSSSGAGNQVRVQGWGYLRPHWVRFDVHSSTNVDGYVSWDGLLFTKWLSAYNPGFTVGSVGLDIHAGDASECAVAVDYIRFEDL